MRCSSAPPADGNDTAQVAAARAQKDLEFQNAPDGQPVPVNRRAELLPLAYFPIDPAYNVAAVLRPSDDRTIIDMPTTTGAPRADAAGGHARVFAERPADEAHGVRRSLASERSII